MNYLSLFTGIGGFDLACDRAGMECVGQVEIDKYCLETLDHHWTNVPKYKDVRDVGIKTHERKTIGLICGGFPCQDLSVAGKRKGLVGERSGLWYQFARIIDELEPKWVVAENVTGLLSSWSGDDPPSDLQEGEEWETKETSDFWVIVSWLAKRGYGVAYRVLDARYFGVPQRRRRVFVVASLGNGNAAKVLFESQSGGGNTAESGEAGQATSCYAVRRAQTSSNRWGIDDKIAHTLDETGGDCIVFDRQSNDHYKTAEATVDTVASRDYKRATDLVAVTFQQNPELANGKNNTGTLLANYGDKWGLGDQDAFRGDLHVIASKSRPLQSQSVCQIIRRLTPTECERLQGFPDDFTAVCNHSDSTRYKQLGNAVAVPVVQWIMDRIASIDKE